MFLASTTHTTFETTRHIGLRWDNVTIPAGATIDVARLGLFVLTDLGGNDEPEHQIRGELDADPGTFTTATNDIDARGRTTATVNWDSEDLGAVDEELWEWGASTAGEGNGANLNGIVQEIVDLPGWASGNALVMIYESITGDAGRILTVFSFESTDPADVPPRLHIEYTA